MRVEHGPVSRPLSGDELWLVLAPVLAFAVAAQIALAHYFGGLDGFTARSVSSVLPVIALVAIPALFLVVLLPVFAKHTTSLLPVALVFAVGLAMRLVHLGTDPILETDHYRYLWDGALVANALNPYAISPQAAFAGGAGEASAELITAGRDIASRINFPELRTIYPGTAQVLFGIAHLIAPWKVDGLRVVLLLAELCTFGLLIALLGELGRPLLLVSLYWVNPLIVFCLANQVHVDALIPPLLLGAILLVQKNRSHGIAGALIGGAAGVKLWPLLMVPLCLGAVWPDKIKATKLVLGFGVVSAIAVAPLVFYSAQEGSGLVAYATRWSNNNAIYAWSVTALRQLGATPAVAEALLRGLLSASIVLTVIWLALRVSRAALPLASAALFATAALFYLSPAQFPWYVVWFLPFAVLAGNRPLLLASATLPSYFLFFPLSLRGETSLFMHYVSLIHAAPVLLWLLLEQRRSKFR